MFRSSSLMVSGTPVATVVDVPKLDVMSWRTTPLWLSRSGPLEPSPGNGPAVSSGMTVQLAAAAADADAVADEPAVAPGVIDAAPGAQAAIAAPTPARPMIFRTWRRARRVDTSNARPWSKTGSLASANGRPS